MNIKQGTVLLKTQPLSLTNSNTAFTINFTTTAASAAYTLEIVTPVASATTVSPCNTIWVDNVNLSQTYKVLDNFATVGNTSSYTATNATLGNTNGTLQTTLGTKPTVAKTYSALIAGTHFLSFEVDAGTCAPLALNTRHIVYEVLNATNAVVYSGTTAGSVSGVAVSIPAAGNYTLRYSLFKSSAEPLACQLMLDNIRWDRRVVADEFATALTGWTPTAQLALLNQTLQLKNTQIATRTLALTANKNYNLSLTILKGTACSSSTVTIRIKNGTAIVAQTPITINASSAVSIPVSLNFTFPSTSLTLEIERTNFNTTSCSALQIDNVYLTERDWVNETFATIGNTSGYASSMPNALALTNTAQQLQLNYIAPSRGMGVSKKVALDKDQKYTIGYSFKNKMGISVNNFVLLELIKDGSIMYTRKLQATEATTFDYTAPATGEYTWRMRSSSIGTTTTQPLTYSLDNLSIFYTYPYTVENCDNLADGYRFGFQKQESENEIYGDGNASFFKYRVSDNRLGRFLSIDPLTAKYPWNSPYAFSENRVIDGIELEGLEVYLLGLNAQAHAIGGGSIETGILFSPNGTYGYVSKGIGIATNVSVGLAISFTKYSTMPNAQAAEGFGEAYGIGAGEFLTGSYNKVYSSGYKGWNITFGVGAGILPVEGQYTASITELFPLTQKAKNEVLKLIPQLKSDLSNQIDNLKNENKSLKEKNAKLSKEYGDLYQKLQICDDKEKESIMSKMTANTAQSNSNNWKIADNNSNIERTQTTLKDVKNMENQLK